MGSQCSFFNSGVKWQDLLSLQTNLAPSPGPFEAWLNRYVKTKRKPGSFDITEDQLIIWLCPTRTENFRIHYLIGWRSRFFHLDRHQDCLNLGVEQKTLQTKILSSIFFIIIYASAEKPGKKWKEDEQTLADFKFSSSHCSQAKRSNSSSFSYLPNNKHLINRA